MESPVQPSPSLPSHRAFATTQWSVVISAGRDSSPGSREALAALCQTYWAPLYAYVRRRVPDVNEAQDLTQAFFAELLDKNYVGQAEQQRGQFRAFLITAFKHFLSREWEKRKAQKRGGGKAPIPLDFRSVDSSIRIEPAGGLTAEQLYDREWAITLLGRIMEKLEAEFQQGGKAEQFQELKGFLIGGRSGQTYAEAAERLQMSEEAARKAASRMRQRYRELLRNEIADTVSGPEEVEAEIGKLFASLKL
jgi:RNA polymerase sigma-70 factor (ECF subfamily)